MFAPVIEEFEKDEGNDTEERTRCACRRDAARCKVPAEHEAENSTAKIDQSESKGPNLLFHLAAEGELDEHVEGNVHKPRVQKHGNDEAEPLIWVFGGRVVVRETAELRKSARIVRAVHVCGCGIGAGPIDRPVLDFRVGAHAWYVASTHVDENIGRGPDHGVELRMDFNRGFSQNAWNCQPRPIANETDLPFLINSAKKTTDCIRVKAYVTQAILPLNKPFFRLRGDRGCRGEKLFMPSGSYLK